MPIIDLNCDLGEAFGNYKMPNDPELMKYVSSVNIACGFHAGDWNSMQETVQLAMKEGLALGAHPGFPDLQGFGRREIQLSPKEIYQITLYQIGALSAFIKAEKGELHHIKAHGALYNMASKNKSMAKAIVQAIHDFDPSLYVYGLSGSVMIQEAESLGLKSVSEVFADRRYEKDGSLSPRSLENSMIQNPEDSLNQIRDMIHRGKVISRDGVEVSILAETLCIHGDSSHAVSVAKTVYSQLIEEGVIIKAPGK